MAKKSMIASAAALAGATTVILGKRNLRTKLSQSIQSMYKKITRKKKGLKRNLRSI